MRDFAFDNRSDDRLGVVFGDTLLDEGFENFAVDLAAMLFVGLAFRLFIGDALLLGSLTITLFLCGFIRSGLRVFVGFLFGSDAVGLCLFFGSFSIRFRFVGASLCVLRILLGLFFCLGLS